MAAKAKVQITIDEDLLRDVDDYCDKNYMNRSWLISQSLMGVLNQQKLMDSMVRISMAMNRIAENGEIDDDTRKEIDELSTVCNFIAKQKL